MKRLAAWAAALPPRRQDLALALALAAYNVGSLIPERQTSPPYLTFALVVLQAVPLTWRRSWPVAVYLAVGIPRSIYDQLNLGFDPLPLASAIAYYTVMNRCSTKVRWVMSALTLVGIIRSQTLPGHTEPYDFFVSLLVMAAAGIAGILSRTYVQAVEARAEQAGTEHDRQVALAAAQERTRIARELHDVVAHHVSLMAVQSEAAASMLPAQPAEAGQAVEIIGRTAREALTELRRLLGVLRGPAEAPRSPAMSPSPSISELDEVLEQVRRAGLTVDLEVQGSPTKLAPGVDLAAYRIIQEALTNTVRHSGAGQATVIVSYEPGYITISVTDTGHGPVVAAAAPTMATASATALAKPGASGPLGASGPPNGRIGNGARPPGPDEAPGPPGPGGFGLAGIVERVASCGGSLTLGPGQAGGFAVTARLPAP